MSDSLRPSRVAVDLTAVVIAVRDAAPSALTVDGPPAALPSGPLEPGHRTLQAGLRARVEAQTGRRLGYVEQLYTFGDRPGGAVGDGDGRTISIAYLALVRPGAEEDPQAGAWRGWYDFLALGGICARANRRHGPRSSRRSPTGRRRAGVAAIPTGPSGAPDLWH